MNAVYSVVNTRLKIDRITAMTADKSSGAPVRAWMCGLKIF